MVYYNGGIHLAMTSNAAATTAYHCTCTVYTYRVDQERNIFRTDYAAGKCVYINIYIYEEYIEMCMNFNH